MNRQFWIIVAVTTTVCGAMFFWQRGTISGLRQEMNEKRSSIAALERPDKKARDYSSEQEASASSTARHASSGGGDSQKKSLVVSDLLALIPGEKKDQNPVHLVRALPEICALLEDHSAEELFVLLEELYSMSAQNVQAEAITGILFWVISDVEPLRILDFLEVQGKEGHPMVEIQTSAFAALARQNPNRAQEYLEKQTDWRGTLKQQAQVALLCEWAQADFQQALVYFRESGLNRSAAMQAFVVAARDERVRNDMREALNEESDPKLYTQLASGLVGATYLDSGYEGVSELLSQMTFSDPDARDQILSAAVNTGLVTNPKETLDWIVREASPVRKSEFLANSIRSWAYQDYTAAGEWLAEQEPSAEMDATVSVYAHAVTQLDPAVAMAWTGEITEEHVRDSARKHVIQEWNRQDSQAAKAWLAEQGLEASDWLPSESGQ